MNNRLQSRALAFTLIELLVVITMVLLLALTLLPALAKSNPNGRTFRCLNNQRQLTTGWRMYSYDFKEALLACENGAPGNRPNWCTGSLNFLNNNISNWDPNADITKSPFWPYTGRETSLFRCPSDQSQTIVSGTARPRVRSYSMNSVFGLGAWLDKVYNSTQTVWPIYRTGTDIAFPGKTFVFADEHPDSMNDSALQTACTGAQPTDSPSAAWIIDFPASWHNGGGAFSFADGRVEVHKWLGRRIQPPVTYTGSMALNVNAGDSYVDVRWLAANTVRR